MWIVLSYSFGEHKSLTRMSCNANLKVPNVCYSQWEINQPPINKKIKILKHAITRPLCPNQFNINVSLQSDLKVLIPRSAFNPELVIGHIGMHRSGVVDKYRRVDRASH